MFDPKLMVAPNLYSAVGSKIHVWQLASGASSMLATLGSHHANVTAMAITQDRKHLVRYVKVKDITRENILQR